MKWLSLLALLLILASCSSPAPQPKAAPMSTDAPPSTAAANLPNPAWVYCEGQGNRLEIRTAADGSQTGVCIFPDGSECDEWAYFRGECVPSGAVPQTTGEIVDGWMEYRDDTSGLTFQYPADATVEIDSIHYTVFVNGPVVENNTWPTFMISYPADREEYQVPTGADLRQWLTDHNLYTDQPQPDAIIAATTAVHTRFNGSEQSVANDRYYFVHHNQIFVITILHTGREDWDIYNRFLESFQFVATEYQGWWTYTHSKYGFSIMLPADWVVEEITTSDPLMNGHTLNMHPREMAPGMVATKEEILMSFRRIDEDARLWPTGVGQGEFVQQGTLDISGQPVRRVTLICPSQEATSIWYQSAEEDQPNIVRNDLEFGFIFSATPLHCEPGYNLSGKTQDVGEMIIASLKVP